MRILKVVLVLLVTINLSALDINKEIDNIYKKNKDNWYSFKTEFGFIGLKNYTYKNSDAKVKETNANPTFSFNFGVNLLPNTYDINIGYTYMMDNRNTWGDEYRGEGYTNDLSFINLSLIPIKTKYGNVGFSYKEHSYTIDTTPDDNQQHIDVIDVKNDGNNDSGYKNSTYLVYGGGNNTNYLLTPQNYKRYTILYTLPSTTKYLPNGSGVSLGYEEGTKAYEGEDFLALKTEYDGYRYGLGINKAEKDLKNGFSIRKFELYMLEYSQNIPYSYRTNKSNISLGKIQESGLETEFIYKFESKSKNTYYAKLNIELASATHDVIRESNLSVVGESKEEIFNGEIYIGMLF